jgi:hypothetical protein
MNDTTSHIQTKLHFQRFEIKYVLDAEIEERIKRRIAPYLVVDPFAENLPSNSYEVMSLYFDSPAYYYYHAKIDGVQKRKKIRLRTYRNNQIFSPYSFFEIKRKVDSVILKDRFVLTLPDYERLKVNNDFHGTEAFRDQNRKNVIQEFEWEKHLRALGPKLLVAYDREPYIGKLNKNFRVTFDKNIRAMENDNLFYIGPDMTDVSGNETVMELKFTGTLPFYIKEMIEEFDLSRTTYSKYCNSIDTCGSLLLTNNLVPKGVQQVYKSIQDQSDVSDLAMV